MKTYLLTWNPDKFAWTQLDQEAVALARGERVESRWSCGNTKNIPAGAHFFMLRQGSKGRGIVGSGQVIRGTYQDLHWDPSIANNGGEANYVRIRLDTLLDPAATPILEVETVQTGALADVYWARPASGTRLEPTAAAELEIIWAEHIAKPVYLPEFFDESFAVEGAELRRLVRHRMRERALRSRKISAAKAASVDGRLRCEVPGCGFDFENRYGRLGRDFAHVHHLLPLSKMDGPTQVTLDDLAVVCANCHAMIHRGGENRPLEFLVADQPRPMSANNGSQGTDSRASF